MGIANIVNTAGGGGGGSSEIITNLVNSVDGAGLRLANSASIKCDDVAANRFGTADFSIEFVISQNAESVNSDIFTSSADYSTPSSPQAKSAAVVRWDVLGNGNLSLVFFNSTGTGTTYDFGVSLTADVDKPTHFVVSADRSSNAVLFRNGAEVASVDISASSSENIGVGGYPAVVGLPNILGFKGNIYRLRTYSKLLSSDEAKNVFDRADVPTALVSNLLLDLDCAYANPTQSTVIQDRGPNNQDGTLNGTITQTNVIKQLNSTSARIGTTAATPADGEVIAGKIVVQTADAGIGPSADADELLLENTGNAGMTILSGNTSDAAIYFGDGDAAGRGRVNYDNNDDSLKLYTAAATRLTIDSSGKTTANALKVLDPTHGRYFDFVLDSSASYLDVSHALNLRVNGASSLATALTIDSTGLATFSNGINLGNTASATATTLDGYEEGTFTVTNNGDTSGVLSSETGEYTRIGNCVFIRVVIRVGTTFSNNRIAGLPFGCVTDGDTSSWFPIGTALTGSATNAPILVAAQNGVANLAFFKQANTVTTHLPSTSEDYYRVTGYYYTTDAF